jgi:SAM-dependent methyltransferase
MRRLQASEIMDDPALPEHLREAGYRDLMRIHRWLGNTRAILRRVRQRGRINRVLDAGCGHGAMLREIHGALGLEVIGVDLHPPESEPGIPILRGDVIRDPLPEADLAVSVCVAHHLSEAEVAAMIRNIGRSCRSLLLLDLVRHPLPLLLYRTFVAPFVHPINAKDGAVSVQRAFTPAELGQIVRTITGSPFRHTVAPLYIRQIIEIDY